MEVGLLTSSTGAAASPRSGNAERPASRRQLAGHPGFPQRGRRVRRHSDGKLCTPSILMMHGRAAMRAADERSTRPASPAAA